MDRNKHSVSNKAKTKQRHSKKKNQRGGVIIKTSQGTYDGEVNSENKPHGQGEMTHNDGSVYKGNWNNGRKNGDGMFSYKNGNTYDGEWIDDKMHGRGEIILSTESGNPRLLYRGHYANHKPNGEAVGLKDREKLKNAKTN